MEQVDLTVCEVEYTSRGICKTQLFNPLLKEVADSLCKNLDVDSEKRVKFIENAVLGATLTIVADGNGFVRTISQVVYGTQKYHRKHVKSNVTRKSFESRIFSVAVFKHL